MKGYGRKLEEIGKVLGRPDTIRLKESGTASAIFAHLLSLRS